MIGKLGDNHTRTSPVLLSAFSDYNLDKHRLWTDKIDVINCIKLKVPTDFPLK